MRFGTLILVVALAGGLCAADAAFAKPVSRAPLAPVAAGALDGAKVRVRVQSKSRGRAEVRIDVERAAQGLALEAWFADAAGTMTYAGDFAADDTPGEYRFRVRTDKGGTLPGGAASASDLSGRAVEIRDAAGTVAASGTMPVVSAQGSNRAKGGTTDDSGGGTSGGGRTGGGADDSATHDAGDDRGGGRNRGRGGSGGGGADDGPNHT